MCTPKTIWFEACAPEMHHSFAVTSVLSAFPLALVGEEGRLGGVRGRGPCVTAGGEIMVGLQQLKVLDLWCWGGGRGCFGHMCRFRAGRMVQLELWAHC